MILSKAAADIPLVPAGLDRAAHHRRDPAWLEKAFASDNVRILPNMFEGDLLIGAFTDGQIGYHRPFLGAGHYRGYLKGLYLCGSCCHPGGNITGLPGYNAANVILSDQGVKASWAPVPVEQRIAALG